MRSLRDAILGEARSAPQWPLRGRAEPVFAMVQRPRRGRAAGPAGLANGLERPGGEDEGVGRDGARLAGLSSARGWSSVPRTGKSPTRFRSSASFSVVQVHSDFAPPAPRPVDAIDAIDKVDEVGLFSPCAFGGPGTPDFVDCVAVSIASMPGRERGAASPGCGRALSPRRGWRSPGRGGRGRRAAQSTGSGSPTPGRRR